MTRTVMIDGFNLDLETGTGVATYARNLSFTAQKLGYEVDVLYGRRVRAKSPLVREIAFFDTTMKGPGWFGRREEEIRTLFSFMGDSASPIPITGAVVTDQFRSRLPYFDRLWNVPTLFTRSTDHFLNWKSTFRVRTDGAPPDLVHWTYPLPIRVAGAKNIYTMHDLVPLRLPFATLDKKRRYLRLMRLLANKADHIVTVSETSRADIINLLDVPEEKVTNTYQAVEIPDAFRNKPEDLVRDELEGVLELPMRGYYLYFGAIEPKKNVNRLVEAYLASNVAEPLILVGKLAWSADQEMRLVNSVVKQRREDSDGRYKVRHMDYVPFSLLVSLIRGAKAVLFPSLYEGFGLPALEAMMLGTPVLSSTGGSLPEVVGDAAILCDPYNPREMSAGIRALDRDVGLRQELVDRGLKRAAMFSAEKYGQRLAALYDRVTGS